MEIIPAIIPKSFEDLESHISQVQDFANTVQIDVMDGQHVPDKSWPYFIKDDPNFIKIKTEKTGLPAWDKLQFEIDLMVKNPEDIWRDWVHAGASRIIVHFESTDNLKQIIADFKSENVSQGSFLYCQLGLAIQITTNNEDTYPFLEDVDFVQCMGIDKIGYQGQTFDRQVLQKIQDLKKYKPDLLISVDGSMNANTIPLVQQAGAERVAVGSAIFESQNIHKTYKQLSRL